MHCKPAILGIVLVWFAGPLFAQPQIQRDESRQKYLEDLGLADTAIAVESALVDLMNARAGFMPAPRQMQIAAYFSFVLTLSGIHAQDIKLLDAEGIDVIHAITADNRPLVEQSLLADFVAIGTVIKLQDEVVINGQSYRDISIRVDDVLKGNTPQNTITIRQRNGLEFGENPREAAQLMEGKTYLLLLSNSLFRYGLAHRDAGNVAFSISEENRASYYSIYRHYEMDGDKVLWSGYNKRKTQKALNEIRLLDSLLM